MADETEDTSKSLTTQESVDFLTDGEVPDLDLTEELKEEKEEKPKKEEKKEEEEVEIEEPGEDDLELSETISRKAILKAYPDIFKKFPGIQRAIYREQAYTEVFPTVDDAKGAAERAKEFDKFEGELLSGKTEGLLEGIKSADKKAFSSLADSFLPTLAKVDQAAYHNILGNVFRVAANQMFQQGTARNNENLKIAAQIFNEFIFGDSQIRAPQQVEKVEEKPDQQDEREAKFRERELNKASDEMTGKIQNLLTSTVEKYIDPNEAMTGYARKNAIKDVLAEVDEAISSDTRFKATFDKLWERASEDDFSNASMDRIKRAYLGKAKTLLAPAIKKIRAEVLKGSQKASEKKEEKPLAAGKPAGAAPKKAETSQGKRISTYDFLSQD